MTKPTRRAIPCGTHLSDRRSDDPQGDDPQGGTSDKGAALHTLAAVTAALQAGATLKLFSGARQSAAPTRPRLDTVKDCIAALRSGVPLTGDELGRIWSLWKREALARGHTTFDAYVVRTRREDEPLQ